MSAVTTINILQFYGGVNDSNITERKNREGDGWEEGTYRATNRCFCSEQYDSTIIPSLQRDISFMTEIAEL